MKLRSAIKILRTIWGYRTHSKTRPGYRWPTAWKAQSVWGRAMTKHPDPIVEQKSAREIIREWNKID